MKKVSIVAVALLSLSVAAVSGQAGGDAGQACTALSSVTISAGMIGLPTKGAAVRTARLVAATAQTKAAPTPFNASGVTLARPEYCEVKGEIAPIDPAAPPIHFQVNLPSEWNGKAVHQGGGGYDGILVTATGPLPRAPDNTPYPLTRGYVTFGSDGGHEGNDASFASNQEALTNFAYAQLKKTHDVAIAVVMVRYRRLPAKTYFVGQSEGGREGLTVVQRFPQDYDGVVVTAPAINYVNLMLRFNDVATALARLGGFLNAPQIKAFADAVVARCDMNDGVKDGIIGNYVNCNPDPAMLRCAAAANDSCLTDAQIATLQAVYAPKEWKDATGKVIASYPRFLVGGGEAQPSNMPTWIAGRAPMPRPQPAGKAFNAQQLGVGVAAMYGNSAVRYLVVHDPAFDTFEFVPGGYARQTADAVKLLASNDPDLSAFQKRGGKLIVLHNTADLAVSSVATMNYYHAVVKALGQKTVDQFVRLYIVPGGDHGGGGDVPSKIDLLGMLDRWIDTGQAPGDDAVAQQFGPDLNVIRSKPLCAYPKYPRYAGNGDPNSAASYRCTPTGS